ncbi:YciI family protein [Amnibacterium sp.]|uniref:YciI family protein n=1 Tax=Amnibacterium sp. TaxID=1872496 RepID=UPI0026147FE3|nr:YciI family protein [Amnibacterium sp.]MCU1473016.1 hypothetical protein [Amnibacterium sp.]
MSDEPQQWYVLLHEPVDPIGAGVFADPRFGLHVAFLGRLHEQGRLVGAGPLDDRPGTGMAVLRGVDENEARRLAEEDESVRQGLFRVRVRPWTVLLAVE